MTRGQITCSACSHAFAVPPNARTAICPRCGQALPVFFGSIEPTTVPPPKPPPTILEEEEEEEEEDSKVLARIKLQKRPAPKAKPPPIPKDSSPPSRPPPIKKVDAPAPDPLTMPSASKPRPDLPPSAPPTFPQMVRDHPQQGSQIAAPQFSRPESGQYDPEADEQTYQMDGPPWMEEGMDEMTGPDLPRRVPGPPIDTAFFSPTRPVEETADELPDDEESRIATQAMPRDSFPGPDLPPDLPGPPVGEPFPSPPPPDLPGPPVDDTFPSPPPDLLGGQDYEDAGSQDYDDLGERATQQRPPVSAPPGRSDPLMRLPTEMEEGEGASRAPSYYDLDESDRRAALDKAITDAIIPGRTKTQERMPPPPPSSPTLGEVPKPPATMPLPAPSPPAMPPLPGPPPLSTVPPPPSRVPGPPPSIPPASLEATGITVFIPERPVQEVQLGEDRQDAISSEPVEDEEEPAVELQGLASPTVSRQVRSAAGHGVAVKSDVAKAEHRRWMLRVGLIGAGGLIVLTGVILLVVYLFVA
jgi:hypothetical protein